MSLSKTSLSLKRSLVIKEEPVAEENSVAEDEPVAVEEDPLHIHSEEDRVEVDEDPHQEKPSEPRDTLEKIESKAENEVDRDVDMSINQSQQDFIDAKGDKSTKLENVSTKGSESWREAPSAVAEEHWIEVEIQEEEAEETICRFTSSVQSNGRADQPSKGSITSTRPRGLCTILPTSVPERCFICSQALAKASYSSPTPAHQQGLGH